MRLLSCESCTSWIACFALRQHDSLICVKQTVPEKSSGVLMLLVSFRLIKEVDECSVKVILPFGFLGIEEGEKDVQE